MMKTLNKEQTHCPEGVCKEINLLLIEKLLQVETGFFKKFQNCPTFQVFMQFLSNFRHNRFHGTER